MSAINDRLAGLSPAEKARLLERLREKKEAAWTWGELARRVEALADQLRALGVGPETRVAKIAGRTPETIDEPAPDGGGDDSRERMRRQRQGLEMQRRRLAQRRPA